MTRGAPQHSFPGFSTHPCERIDHAQHHHAPRAHPGDLMMDQLSHAGTPSVKSSVAGPRPRNQQLRSPRSSNTERDGSRELHFHEPIPNLKTQRRGPCTCDDSGYGLWWVRSKTSVGQCLESARTYSRLRSQSCRRALRDGEPTRICRPKRLLQNPLTVYRLRPSNLIRFWNISYPSSWPRSRPLLRGLKVWDLE